MRTLQNGVSGWYARLDRCLDNEQQIDIWLTTWEQSLKTFQPIAALPEDGLPFQPTSRTGAMLDRLLARHDAESDGRSPSAPLRHLASPMRFFARDEGKPGQPQKPVNSPTSDEQPFAGFPPTLNNSTCRATQDGEIDDEAEHEAVKTASNLERYSASRRRHRLRWRPLRPPHSSPCWHHEDTCRSRRRKRVNILRHSTPRY